MAKWADNVITEVKRARARIVEVVARSDHGDTISSDTKRLTRERVVAAILSGTTFATAYRREGKWQKGDSVRIVKIGNERFLRTDGNAVDADNLGALPEYS